MRPKTKGWIYVAVQFVLIAAILAGCLVEKSLYARPYTYYGDAIAFVMFSAGALIFLISLMNFGKIVTPNPVPRADYELRTNGMYSKIRHPIYFSVLLLMLGCIFFFAAYFTLSLFAVLTLFFHFKMNFEEKQLSGVFPTYANYKKRTHRMIPFVY